MEFNNQDIIDLDEVVTSSQQDETEPAEEHIPIPLTQAKCKPLTTLYLEYINDLPEYPTSDLHGYTYIVSAGSRSQAEIEQVVNDIQYSKFQHYGQKRPVYCPFLNCQVRKWTWKCSGVYCCEFLAERLKAYHHTSVDESVWLDIQKYQSSIQLLKEDIGKRNAYSYYRSKLSLFKRGHACIDQLPYCKPVFKRHTHMNVNGTFTPYIGCVNDTTGPLSKHHRMGIQGHAVLDLQLLEDLFNKNLMPAAEECGVFEPLVSRKKHCDRDHSQGPGHLIHYTCDAIFNALVPVDIVQCPYFLFVSHGVHKHPPPPPTKAPERILQGVKDLILQIRDPTMTTSQFLRSPQLETFCQQYNASTLAEIHTSFCNKDRIAAIIQKQRLLSYPNGQEIDGLIFLQTTEGSFKEYIQEYYHDAQSSMVFCGYKSQIQLLSQLQSFEVDMSYKRIQAKEMNEVLFATFLPEQAKIITLLRVFTNIDSTEGYYLLFKRAFALLERVSGRPVCFDYLHNSGIYGIIVDMDTKQYSGLGQYLAEIDPEHNDSIWQLQHIIVFCRFHFQRNILKAIGTRQQGSGLWSRMMELLTCESEEQYDTLIELLIKYEPPPVQNWAIQKKAAVIKAGLNKACSRIQPVYFDQLRNYTNAVEQSHQKSYASGKYLTLVEAVRNSAKLDKDDILQYQSFVQFNVHHSSRTANMEVNYLRSQERERSRKRQRLLSADQSEYQTSRSVSQHSLQRGDNESSRSTRSLRQVASTNSLSVEKERQQLELRKLRADVQNLEEEVRAKQLENERVELELMERRMRIREAQAEGFCDRF